MNDHSDELLTDMVSSYLFIQRKIDEIRRIVDDLKEFTTETASDDMFEDEDLIVLHQNIDRAKKLLDEIDGAYPPAQEAFR